MRRVIIYDSDHPGAKQNKCFEKEYSNKGQGHSFTVELAEQGVTRGFDLMTADVFLSSSNTKGLVAFALTDMYSANTENLLRRGVIPFLNFSMESPLIARTFYTRINHYAGRYIYATQFGGTYERLKNSPCHFETMYFPVSSRIPLSAEGWARRKYITMINSNKRVFRTDYSTLKSSVHSFVSKGLYHIQKITDSWIKSKEIYKDRLELIKYFSAYSDFELYGVGWNNPISGFSNVYHEAAKRSYKGVLDYNHKYLTLNKFKFNICFENCSFPGYVTEKIFDSFLAGSIPVYFGAPDILNFVPRGSFIDYSEFNHPQALDSYLKTLPEGDAMKMLALASDFLASSDFEKYLLKNFIRKTIDKIDDYSNNKLAI